MNKLCELSTRLTMLCLVSSSLAILQGSYVVSAHSGGLDSNGGHAGSQPYHCHRSPCKSTNTTTDTTSPTGGIFTGETPAATAKQTFQILSVSPHCFDDFDELEAIYLVEGAKPCKINVRVTGRGAMKSKIVLQISDGYEDWVHYSAIKTTDTKGRSFFALSFEPNEDCYEGEQFEFRFAVAKSGSFKAFKSGIFLMAFVSDEDSPSCTLGEDDYGDN